MKKYYAILVAIIAMMTIDAMASSGLEMKKNEYQIESWKNDQVGEELNSDRTLQNLRDYIDKYIKDPNKKNTAMNLYSAAVQNCGQGTNCTAALTVAISKIKGLSSASAPVPLKVVARSRAGSSAEELRSSTRSKRSASIIDLSVCDLVEVHIAGAESGESVKDPEACVEAIKTEAPKHNNFGTYKGKATDILGLSNRVAANIDRTKGKLSPDQREELKYIQKEFSGTMPTDAK